MSIRLSKNVVAGIALAAVAGLTSAPQVSGWEDRNQVLEWNQIFVETLIATNTPNSASQRLGAIVHSAIFDAYNGIEQRYEPIFVHDTAPPGASRRATVIAAAHGASRTLPVAPGGTRRQLRRVARGRQRR